MTRLMALCLLAALTALLLRRAQPPLAQALTVAAAALVCLAALGQVRENGQAALALAQRAGAFPGGVQTALKIAALALAGDFAARTCRDLGSDSLAAQAELCGRAAICAALLPVLTGLVDQVARLCAGG